MGKKDERPPFWRPMARAKWDGARQSYGEYVARNLTDNERETFDVEVPTTWRNQPMTMLRNVFGVSTPPKGSGAGFVQVPYVDVYTKVYGVTPIVDLAKYRLIFRNNPDIMQAIEMQVNLAVGKGFTIEHPDQKVVSYLKNAVEELGIYKNMLVMAADMLVYGNSYTEVCWDKLTQDIVPLYEIDGQVMTADEVEDTYADEPDKIKKAIPAQTNTGKYVLDELKAELTQEKFDSVRPFTAQRIMMGEGSKTILQLKPLDPVYMRVRRDAYNNIYGYIQWLTWPPALIDPDSMMHIKYREKSWAYESAYGTSVLMPLIKNADLYNQFENDAAVWIHGRAVPPLLVQGGSVDKPYTTTQMNELMTKLKSRGAASMVFTKGDVAVKEIEGAARALNVDWWINLLSIRRYQATGVPAVLMGMKDTVSQGSSEVVFQEFITRLQLLQQLIGDAVEEKVLYPLAMKKFEKEGKKLPRPHIVWKPIIEEDRNMRAQRLIQALQAGAISVNEYRREMGFDIVDKPEFNEMKPLSPLKTPSGDEAQDEKKTKDLPAKPSPSGKKA